MKDRKKFSENRSLVVKDNKLINARYSLSLAETRLFLAMVAQVRREDEDFKTYRLNIAEFASFLDTSSKSIYERAKDVSRQIQQRVLEIDEPGSTLQLSLFSSARYYDGKGYVEVRFDPALKPYLLQLKEKFTQYDIRNVLSLHSSHSVRIYELLKQFEKIGQRRIEVADLRHMLGLEGKYRSYNTFKKRVILQAQKELAEKCDIAFTFREEKTGRSITAIRFFIKRQPRSPKRKEVTEIAKALMQMGLSEEQAQAYNDRLPAEKIRDAIAYTQKRYKAGRVQNPGAYLASLLDRDIQVVSEFERHAQEEKQAGQVVKTIDQVARQKALQLRARFDDIRSKELDQLTRNATAQDWQEFESWASAQPYLRKKIFAEGRLKSRENTEAISYLKTFLADRLPPADQAFISWAADQGISLEKLTYNGTDTFVVVSEK